MLRVPSIQMWQLLELCQGIGLMPNGPSDHVRRPSPASVTPAPPFVMVSRQAETILWPWVSWERALSDFMRVLQPDRLSLKTSHVTWPWASYLTSLSEGNFTSKKMINILAFQHCRNMKINNVVKCMICHIAQVGAPNFLLLPFWRTVMVYVCYSLYKYFRFFFNAIA